jgi:arsenate reductase
MIVTQRSALPAGSLLVQAMNTAKILFLCTGNSCRSQMAEGWARALKPDSIEPHSAGVAPQGMNATAVQVMAEAGVDISTQRSKHVDELTDVPFDFVVTVCDHANENCPVFAGNVRRVHVGFDDPPRLAKSAKSFEEALGHYRRVRDQIREWVMTLPQSLADGKNQ